MFRLRLHHSQARLCAASIPKITSWSMVTAPAPSIMCTFLPAEGERGMKGLPTLFKTTSWKIK